ncbi:SPOR domain-containing protein [Aminobacter sp. Piv2-1]|uniref:SPOR domain-containing protein n=1 Tax=Aminobacter sp. Piv2-1 TaxID=3031122 RepID=UPI0030A0D78C
MADRTQLKIADNKNDLADEDPFAELTRIMGFDPRQPVVRQDSGAPAGRAEPAMDDDFGIDLEKELLGKLAGEDLAAAPEREAAAGYETHVAYEAPAAYEAADVHSPYEEPAAPQFASESEYEPYSAQAYSAQEPAYGRAPEPEFEADGAFDDAVAASFDEGFALEDELVEAPRYQAAPQVDREQHVASTAEAGQAFDDALDESFEQHFTIEDELLPAEEAAAPVYEAPAEPDLDVAFDAALADVDMDFAVHGDAAHASADKDEAGYAPADETEMTLGGYEPVETVAYSDEDMVVETPAAAPVAQAQDYDEFERRLQDALTDEPAYEAPVVAASAYEPVAVQQVEPVSPPARTEDSLEDELNALLGTMSSQAKALSNPVVVPLRPAAEPVMPADAPAHSKSLWAPAQPAEIESQPVEADYAVASAADEPVYAESTYAEPAYAEPTYDRQADDEVSFDDEAFDLAFERSSEAEAAAPVEPAAAPVQPAPDRPLAASRYEHARSWGLGTPVAPRSSPMPDYSGYRPQLAVPQPVAAAVAAPVVASYQAPRAEVPAYEPEVEATDDMQDDLEAELFAAVSAVDDAPDIETVDVPEKAIALADDLDIPELTFEDETPPASAYDDLEGEFSSLMNEMQAAEPAPVPASSNYASNPYAAGFDRQALREATPARPAEFPAAAAAGAIASAAAAYAGSDRSFARGGDHFAGHDARTAPQAQSGASHDEFAFDPDFDEAMAASDLPGSPAPARPARRGLMIAAIVGAVAVVGGIGALALSFGGSDGADTPVVLKADDGPMKVRPENPGGAIVPNQDNKVYDRVAGGSATATPTQEKLVANTEEPIDVVAQEAEARANDNVAAGGEQAAAPKSEDRVQQAIEADQPVSDDETAAVAPRKVRTMVVRPDGSLVPREDPAPAPQVAAAEPADPAPQRVAEPGAEATGTVPSATAKPALAPVAPAKPAQSAETPASAPIAPQRPSEQPVNVVGEVKPDQVAALAPAAPATAAAGAWAMQIASQPSEEAAKSTYQDLLRRYNGVLNGREVSIVKAEIAGKGTFWRVRVPAGTRNDAVALCESYKAAGGNCFVSK